MNTTQLVDTFGRKIDYLRFSITDRCDFRCLYCMAEEMQFLPRSEVLTLEEIVRISQAFVDLGVRKIRITGGEPLIRKDAVHLMQELGRLESLNELCMTTNGSQLGKLGAQIAQAGVSRLNISLDSLIPERFTQLTRHGKLEEVLKGIDVARESGFDKIKINSVLMKNFNLDEILNLTQFALDKQLDISFIEEMPLGEVDSHSRRQEYISSAFVRDVISQKYQLSESDASTGGPSRYWNVTGYESKVGFISPHSENFCSDCNRVRITASGRLLLCLGNEDSIDLKEIVRQNECDTELKKAIVNAMQIKPEKHEFTLHEKPQILRFMNTTGG